MAICETWSDHEWTSGRLLGAGRHPTNGRYETVERRCERCGKPQTETRWLAMDRRVAMLGQSAFEGGQ